MHGDLVFTNKVLKRVINSKRSVVTVSSTLPLPEKDFKAVIKNNKVDKIGIEFFDSALSCQPLYKFNKKNWNLWLNNIIKYIDNGICKCYAENALNELKNKSLYPLDIKNELCGEIDNLDDLERMKRMLKEVNYE